MAKTRRSKKPDEGTPRAELHFWALKLVRSLLEKTYREKISKYSVKQLKDNIVNILRLEKVPENALSQSLDRITDYFESSYRESKTQVKKQEDALLEEETFQRARINSANYADPAKVIILKEKNDEFKKQHITLKTMIRDLRFKGLQNKALKDILNNNKEMLDPLVDLFALHAGLSAETMERRANRAIEVFSGGSKRPQGYVIKFLKYAWDLTARFNNAREAQAAQIGQPLDTVEEIKLLSDMRIKMLLKQQQKHHNSLKIGHLDYG